MLPAQCLGAQVSILPDAPILSTSSSSEFTAGHPKRLQTRTTSSKQLGILYMHFAVPIYKLEELPANRLHTFCSLHRAWRTLTAGPSQPLYLDRENACQ
ncbi:jg11950 [Pararge aegeria aegeria]|uniref:Jg11950 protein n=1 Tax=Pararge aegeria aegeria TaxID=348720 RepID=A0A8S4SD53_9NEOP|nr:jg11950 [Pararge aegeria aegeria]